MVDYMKNLFLKYWKWIGLILIFAVSVSVLAKEADNETRTDFSSMDEDECREWLEKHNVSYPNNSDGVDWKKFALEYARLIEQNNDYPDLFGYTVAADFMERIRDAIIAEKSKNVGCFGKEHTELNRYVLQYSVA